MNQTVKRKNMTKEDDEQARQWFLANPAAGRCGFPGCRFTKEIAEGLNRRTGKPDLYDLCGFHRKMHQDGKITCLPDGVWREI